MKLTSPLPHRKARIEIIPLIDIMFFLLASFMLVSLSMIRMSGLKMTLPVASSASPETKPDFITITVNPAGEIFFEKDTSALPPPQLTDRLKPLFAQDANLRVYINADRDATHGSIVDVLDRVRGAGIQKVSFAIKAKGASPAGAASSAVHPADVSTMTPGTVPPVPAPPASAPAAP